MRREPYGAGLSISESVVAVGPGSWIYLSGRIPLDAAGEVVAGPMRDQAELCFAQIEAALAKVGAALADVVKLTVFTTDLGRARRRQRGPHRAASATASRPAPRSRWRRSSAAPSSRSRRVAFIPEAGRMSSGSLLIGNENVEPLLPDGPRVKWAGRVGRVWGTVRTDRQLAIPVAILVFVVLFAIFVPILWGPSPEKQNLLAALEAPSGAHPMGTDQLGRDVLARVDEGARISLSVAT